jgi:hypothetical protein
MSSQTRQSSWRFANTHPGELSGLENFMLMEDPVVMGSMILEGITQDSSFGQLEWMGWKWKPGNGSRAIST